MIYLELVSFKEKGIKKKIDYQIKALNKYLGTVKWIGPKGYDSVLLIKDKVYKLNFKCTFFDKVLKKIKFSSILINLKKYSFKEKEKIYIRYFGSSYLFIKFLKFLKKKNIKIILEIPTYPYDCERIGNSLIYLSDKIYRKKLYKYVDKIVTYSEDKEIWGIPCINISNGIDLEEVQMINKKTKDKIVFTSVSNCSFWHGIDRLLLSLDKYGKLKDKREIKFNIVGEGSESNKLKEIVSKSQYLSKVVVFQGFKLGKDLDDIYDETDIGIGSLARHRSGLETMRALKNREYCAKGLPMIFSEDDPDLRDVPFVYHVLADEQLIDIESVIKWYENMGLEPEEIREYSKQFSWDIQMKKVIDEIEKI